MARITIDDCLEQVDNRFTLVHLAAKRVRQIQKGQKPMVDRNNRNVVLALREIAAGLITIENIHSYDKVDLDEAGSTLDFIFDEIGEDS